MEVEITTRPELSPPLEVHDELNIIDDYALDRKYFTQRAYNCIQEKLKISLHVSIWQNFIDIVLYNFLPEYEENEGCCNEYYDSGFARNGQTTLNLSDFTIGGVAVAYTKSVLHRDEENDYRFYASRYAWVNYAISSLLLQYRDDEIEDLVDKIKFRLQKLHIIDYILNNIEDCVMNGLWWDDIQSIGSAWIMVNYKARIIQRAFRNYQLTKKRRCTITRITSRLNTYREELIAKALHPDRILQTYEPCDYWT